MRMECDLNDDVVKVMHLYLDSPFYNVIPINSIILEINGAKPTLLQIANLANTDVKIKYKEAKNPRRGQEIRAEDININVPVSTTET
eukprot:UN03124